MSSTSCALSRLAVFAPGRPSIASPCAQPAQQSLAPSTRKSRPCARASSSRQSPYAEIGQVVDREAFQPREVGDRECIESQIQLGQAECHEDRVAGAAFLALHDDADVAVLPAEFAARRVLVLP